MEVQQQQDDGAATLGSCRRVCGRGDPTHQAIQAQAAAWKGHEPIVTVAAEVPSAADGRL
jgi:hypothetical protein